MILAPPTYLYHYSKSNISGLVFQRQSGSGCGPGFGNESWSSIQSIYCLVHSLASIQLPCLSNVIPSMGLAYLLVCSLIMSASDFSPGVVFIWLNFFAFFALEKSSSNFYLSFKLQQFLPIFFIIMKLNW